MMQGTGLRLNVATPACIFVDDVEIVALRAEDDSGSFGIRAGHADFVTLLSACVVQWRTADGAAHFCAVDGGVLIVSHGNRIAIACREAILGESFASLESDVRRTRAEQVDADRRARVEQMRLHAQAVRQIVRYLRPAPASDGAGLPEQPASVR